MIGKSLSERHSHGRLPGDRAITLLKEALPAQAKFLVEVRARGTDAIACLVASADKESVRLCRSLGFALRLGGDGVFGVVGADAARLLPRFTEEERRWLETPCGPRETKVLLLAGGHALLSIETADGKVSVRLAP